MIPAAKFYFFILYTAARKVMHKDTDPLEHVIIFYYWDLLLASSKAER